MSSVLSSGGGGGGGSGAYINKGIQCTHGDASKSCMGMGNPTSLQRKSWAVFPGKSTRSCKNLGKLTMLNPSIYLVFREL